MTQTMTFAPLSLDLPSSRMSVDFTNFVPVTNPASLSRPRLNNTTQSNQPQRLQYGGVQRRPVPQRLALPEVKEEQELDNAEPPRTAFKWPWNAPSTHESVNSDVLSDILSRTNSNASNASSRSTASYTSASSVSTAASSIFSNTQSISTANTSYSSLPYIPPVSKKSKNPPTLSSLPLSLLEHILSYVLDLPLTVAIGPENAGLRHMQYRYHRAGLDYVDIGLLMKHPVFLVSSHVRSVSLDIVHRKCNFVIDLHRIYHTKVSSTVTDNLKTHKKFWLGNTPKIVKDVLCSSTKFHIRLPVPSTEADARRGRDEDDWMDGSDGKGGGSWRVKSMKREQEDAVEIRKFLSAIKELIMTDPRSRPNTKETKTKKNLRSTEKVNELHGSPSSGWESDNIVGRRPLKRIEIVLVKRSPYATVLPDVLSLVGILRSIPVTGYTNYFFELEGQRIQWATRYRKKWEGMRPDGQRLYQDLQALSVAEKPIEPICTPTEFKFVNINDGRLQLSDSAMPKTPITLERRKVPEKKLPTVPPSPAKALNPLAWNWNKTHKRQDSYGIVAEEGMKEAAPGMSLFSKRKRPPPPSVEELQKIADDIRNGLY